MSTHVNQQSQTQVAISDSHPYVVGVLSTILLLCLFVGCDQTIRNADFHSGRAALSKANYQQAETLLARFVMQNPSHQLCSRAFFLRGKAQIGLNDYDRATQFFKDTIRRFPTSEEAHKSRYKLGMLHVLKGETDSAIAAFQDIVDRPSGTLVPESAAMARMLSQKDAPPE